MRVHARFEWDARKADANKKKHSITFDDAARVLSDDEGDYFHVDEFDALHSDDERRYVTTASHPDCRDIVLRIAWTVRDARGGQITRIISARIATRRERLNYAEEISKI